MPVGIPCLFLDTTGAEKCNPRLGIYFPAITTLWKVNMSLVNNLAIGKRQAAVKSCVYVPESAEHISSSNPISALPIGDHLSRLPCFLPSQGFISL